MRLQNNIMADTMESSLTQSHSATVFTKPYSTIHSTKIKVSHILTSCAHRTPTVRSPYAHRTQTVCSPYANRTPTVRSPVIHCDILGKSSACGKKCRSTGVPLVGFQLVGDAMTNSPSLCPRQRKNTSTGTQLKPRTTLQGPSYIYKHRLTF